LRTIRLEIRRRGWYSPDNASLLSAFPMLVLSLSW
jgi:hypothetical protein